MALITTSCSGKIEKKEDTKESPETFASSTEKPDVSDKTGSASDGDTNAEVKEPDGLGDFDDNILGEGEKDFKFSATDIEGNVLRYHIYTDAETVGEALMEHGLIEGEEGQYGLYVKTVCGVTADYDIDQTYWMFCINGEQALTGVDMTEIENGTTYNFIVSK
ncbi:MAG: DUF4430 domain-containing protein [Ruminococcaceae bacterium]|nr:DUF4430 domain-containing protein [Oscillospiraceae bacterium]